MIRTLVWSERDIGAILGRLMGGEAGMLGRDLGPGAKEDPSAAITVNMWG
jgi:hypothetical protein